MRRFSASLLILLLLPLVAVAQQRAGEVATSALSGPTPSRDSAASGWVVPVWRAPDGRILALIGADRQTQFPLLGHASGSSPMYGLLPAGGNEVASAGLRYSLSPNLYSSVSVNKLNSTVASPACAGPAMAGLDDCATPQRGWQGGALVGGIGNNAMFLNVGLNWLQHDPSSNGMLLIMPEAGNSSLLGVPSYWVDSMSSVDAEGSLRLGDTGTRLNMGASVGRMRLLPGRVRVRPDGMHLFSGFEPGVDAIDQKALSLGMGKGAVSGSLVGRVMQPVGASKLSSQGHQWSAIDLGITVRLPWEGELSLGAQNLWSSGNNPGLSSKDADPTQNRIPYIQYHQEL